MSDARAISGVRRTRRQRRPSGAPPPLPRQIGLSTMTWLALAAILVSAAFLQRWGARRVVVAAAMIAAALAIAGLAVSAFRSTAVNIDTPAPYCDTGHSMILSAQAVPSSRLLPCIAALPSGWTVERADITSGRSVFWLDSDQAGTRAVTVSLTAGCDTSGAVRIPSDQAGAQRFERPLKLQPRFTLRRMYTFDGGCIAY